MPRAPKPQQTRSGYPREEPPDFHSVAVETLAPVDVTMFEEPDHAPEVAAQRVYAGLREDVYAGWDDEEVVAHRLPSGTVKERHTMPSSNVHTGPRSVCNWPSHQRWAVEKFGRSRDDGHIDE